MNSSTLTAIIAQGVFLWAKVQSAVPSSEVHKGRVEDFDLWTKDFGPHIGGDKAVELVKKIQSDLFDKVNANF